jgi:hypothetical protein
MKILAIGGSVLSLGAIAAMVLYGTVALFTAGYTFMGCAGSVLLIGIAISIAAGLKFLYDNQGLL